MNVCVIIPAYNAEGHIAATLRSVLEQTVPLEVIVVDDGSTDDTIALARAAGERVTVLTQANSGPAVARNLAVSRTDAEVLAFLDADDQWTPNRIAAALEAFAADPTLDVHACQAQNIDSQGRAIGDPVVAFAASGLAMRRRAWDRVGRFNPDLPHGTTFDWLVRAREAGVTMVAAPEVMLLRVLHGQNMSVVDPAENHREHLGVLRAALARRRQSEQTD